MAAPWTILLKIEVEVPIKGQSEGQDEFGQKRIKNDNNVNVVLFS